MQKLYTITTCKLVNNGVYFNYPKRINMKTIKIKTIEDEVLANIEEKISSLPYEISLKDIGVDEIGYYYPIYNARGEFESYELLATKQQILSEEYNVNI